MRLSVFICLNILFHLNTPLFGQVENEPDTTPFIIGETISIKSEYLSEQRKLNIYLPADYAPDSIQYHVIYLLDGSASEDFIHIAGIVQFANFPWVSMLPPSIVVGIENIDRYRDFTFKPDKQEFIDDFPGYGMSGPFISFLKHEVIPAIEKRYATDSTRTIIGQSLGGLLATEILFTYPDTFTNYIIISPSLWWNDQSLLEKHEGLAYAADQHNVYIGVGDEHEVMKKDAKSLAALLEEKYSDNIKLHYSYFGEADHANILHIAVYNAFDMLFKPEKK